MRTEKQIQLMIGQVIALKDGLDPPDPHELAAIVVGLRWVLGENAPGPDVRVEDILKVKPEEIK